MAKKRKQAPKSGASTGQQQQEIKQEEQEIKQEPQEEQEEEQQQEDEEEQIPLNDEDLDEAIEEVDEEDEEEEEEQQQQQGGGDDEEDEEKQLKDENTPVQNDIQTKVTESNHNPNPNGGGGEKKEEEDDDDGEEPVQNLLEPFTKDQLMEILREAAENHSDVLEHIRKLSDTDPVHRKIFVHGLGWDTNSEVLTEVFNKYGEIEDCNAVTDKITGKSKGYAFILFKHRSGARKALKEPQKKIGSRMTACQLASAGPVPTQSQAPVPPSVTVSEYTQRKIYVSNVSADIDPQKLVTFFSKFGEIEEGPLGLDKQTGKPKGFALFVYRSVESAKKALEEPHKTFEGHVLHCQKAIDGPKPNKHYNQHQQHAHGGGRPSKFPRTDNSNFGGNHASGGAGGHLMAQSAGAGMQFNQGASQALNPVLGQALTALLTTQSGGGLGLTNLLGTLGSTGVPINPAGPPMMNTAMQGGYGHHHAGSGYGGQPGMQGGYSHSQMGQGSAGRSQKGYTGGHNPYMGH